MAKKTGFTAFRLPPEDLERLREIARQAGRPLSELLRSLAEKHLGKEADMRDREARDVPDILDLMSGGGGSANKAAQAQSAAASLLEAFDRKPVWRNGIYYPGGLEQIRASSEIKAKEAAGELVVKESVPFEIKSFQELDTYRKAYALSEADLSDAVALEAMVANINTDKSQDAREKYDALEALADEFKARLDRLPGKNKERAVGKALETLTLAQIHQLAERMRGK